VTAQIQAVDNKVLAIGPGSMYGQYSFGLEPKG